MNLEIDFLKKSYLFTVILPTRAITIGCEFIYYKYMSAEEKKEIDLAYTLFCIYDTTVHIG